MEIYKEIRKYKEHEGLSQRTVSKRLGISRNTVKKYWTGEKVPWKRKEGSGRNSTIITDEVKEFIKSCFKEDEETGIKKQHHTAKRIYDRLTDEKDFTGSESSVRRIVAQLKDKPKKAFIPLEYAPAEAMQVDWGEATIYICGQKTKINIWCMRECYSGDIYCEAFYRQNSESFLEGMQSGFEHFGGVPKRIIFDNAKIAVKEGFGYHAKATDKYLAMSAHYAFEPVFCNIGEGHEKGLVEGLVGYIRRNTMVPVPKVSSIGELNGLLKQKCLKYRLHHIKGKPMNVGEMSKESEKRYTPLPPYRYDTSNTIMAKVNDFSLIRFDHNKYSIPYIYTNKTLSIKGYGNRIEIYYQGKKIVEYDRIYKRNQIKYTLEHYFPLIEQRPRSVYNAAPVLNTVPKELLNFAVKLNNPKDVVKLLKLYLEYGDKIIKAVRVSGNLNELEGRLIEIKYPLFIQDEIKVNKNGLNHYDNLIKGGAAI